ncbi:hypothetical protein [uncultured Aquimonas sp.]|uniref:hypothetical protein n=1 Tax=uncultured Aquimonas sp. TaxID=385483 RepID=UPI00086B8247|nr:hypothetical protein [uncultured Aquimonas sp.]ODU44686.1 MAG: hypothetical protein ABS96_17825 [Xanthomonadaceae bacterium SCN 69-123]
MAERFGAWSGDEAALAAVEVTGRGGDADLPGEQRFPREVAQLLARRERRDDAEFDQPAAFVLTPASVFESLNAAWGRNPLLRTGNRRVTGQIHAVSATLTGRSMEVSGGDDALFGTLAAHALAELPTIVYTPKRGYSTISLYLRGVAYEDDVEVHDLDDEAPSLEAIIQAIDRAYEQELITPDQMRKGSLWKDAPKFWAIEEAEFRVQDVVRFVLLGRFLRCQIRAEQPGKEGRTDLEIVSERGTVAGHVIHHAVLELKVLREKGSTGRKYQSKEIDDHIRDGLEQAHAYGSKRNMREKILCCFDMRATNPGDGSVFAHVADEAQRLNVVLCRWFLYNSSAAYRAVLASA